MWKKLRDRWQKPKKQDPNELLKLHTKYKDVFSSPQGEDVLFHICKAGFVFDSTFVANDPHQTALNEGSRRMALAIVRFVDRDFGELQRINETINDT